MRTIRHQDVGVAVVAAKLLTGYVTVSERVEDCAAFVRLHETFDADYVSYTVSWQAARGLTPDGVIGPETWAKIAEKAPTCSTNRNRIRVYTLALQLIIGGNLTADAIFGPRTKAAVVTVQDAHKLVKDGIVGPRTWEALLTGGEEGTSSSDDGDAKPFVQPPDFKQGDLRWGKKMYSSHGDAGQTMANSGCGPTAAADVVAALKDSAVTPWELAQMAMAWGDRTYNSGTAWTFFKHLMTEFGFSKMVQSAGLDALKACLDAGGYVVCSMGPGYWTSGGHFITAWKYDGTYIYAKDPPSSAREKQKITDFMKQRKQFFCFYPDMKPTTTEEPEKPVVTGYRGEKIVDISKYQPDVDYDALLGDTALVILRAGYRGTLGSVKMDECFKQHADALTARGARFGVYFYSIADTEAKAREEARKFAEYAGPYKPLFYAMDAEKPEITSRAISAFADELKKLGVREGCYVANHLYGQYGYDNVRDGEDFTWIPLYGSTRPKYRCDLWQYTSTGSVAGINGNVDMSRITGDGHNLAWFLGGDVV